MKKRFTTEPSPFSGGGLIAAPPAKPVVQAQAAPARKAGKPGPKQGA